jgi:hypothetical protein
VAHSCPTIYPISESTHPCLDFEWTTGPLCIDLAQKTLQPNLDRRVARDFGLLAEGYYRSAHAREGILSALKLLKMRKGSIVEA